MNIATNSSIRSLALGTLAFILLATLTSPLSAQSIPLQIDSVLNQVMTDDRLPSISVAISIEGNLLYSNALGYLDIENHIPATINTRYPVGSVSKTITAAAALKLSEQNKLDLDVSLQDYCPAFPDKQVVITIRQLLAHTGGIRHYDYRRFDEDFLNKRHFNTIDEALSKFADDSLVAVPGTKYHYSSWGYVLVGCAIEGASGLTYSEYIQSQIVQPANMTNTRLDIVGEIVRGRSRGYSKNDTDSLVNAGLFDSSDRYPAGGILSTPVDLVRFVDALLEGRILYGQSMKEMWSSSTITSNEKTGHGLGWDISADGKEIFQGGSTVGATSFLFVQPDKHLVIAIAVNLSLWSRNRHELAQKLAEICTLNQRDH